MEFAAHIRETDNAIQTVSEHCKNTAVLMQSFLERLNMKSVGRLVGMLHDAGKLTKEFNDYINGMSNAPRGSIDHSYAGARYLAELCHKENLIHKTASISMAHTVVSHHGLHDWVDENCEDYFEKRISKNDNYNEVISNISVITDGEDMEELFEQAVKEWFAVANKPKSEDATEFCFYLGMLERLIQSALIDADRTDTADFMSAMTTSAEADCLTLWHTMDSKMDDKLKTFGERTDKISECRRSISDRCAAFAGHRVGACRLIVPTGGGKTLSSLRFAIKQCKQFGLQRIFYIAPFMSILEQNSDIIRELAGDENFLEHHSNIISEIEDENEYDYYMLGAQRWDKPVIATTMVQFLNSLFSDKTSSVRRMHRMCNSVIIIDEVQSVPLRCTNLFSLAVNFLTKVCNSTVVLCSATQPTFENNEHKLILDEQADMIENYDDDFGVLCRTRIIPVIQKYGYDFGEAADFCCEKFRENGDLLVVVNTKTQALHMYELLKQKADEQTYIIHLSTNMCPAHRKKRIKTFKKLLESKKHVICVTTQLIEAGVDISFRCVVRALAGLDNAAQAAGRCNRNGEHDELCPVYLINFKNEKLGSLEQIKTAQSISRNILARNDEFADILSVPAQSEFFRQLFELYKDRLSYPTKENATLLELLSHNEHRWEVNKKSLRELSQAFKTAGRLFEVIDSNTQDVIVPYNKKAQDIIAELNSDIAPHTMAALLRKAQKYTVSLYAGARQKLYDAGAVYISKNGVAILDKRFYSSEFGVTSDGSESEVLMI